MYTIIDNLIKETKILFPTQNNKFVTFFTPFSFY